MGLFECVHFIQSALISVLILVYGLKILIAILTKMSACGCLSDAVCLMRSDENASIVYVIFQMNMIFHRLLRLRSAPPCVGELTAIAIDTIATRKFILKGRKSLTFHGL